MNRQAPLEARPELSRFPKRRVANCFKRRETPAFGPGDAWVWSAAASMLIRNGALAAGEYGVRALHAALPEQAWAASMARLFDMMPPADPAMPDLRDDPDQDVQTLVRAGATTGLLVFCHRGHELGMPLPMMHRWLARLGVSLVYLRDFNDLGFLKGVRSFGDGMGATQAALRRLASDIGASRLVCYGLSSGGYGSLRYGLDLEADAISVGGPVNMDPDFHEHLNQGEHALRFSAACPDVELDLRKLYDAAPSPPRTLAIYGQRHWNERVHAEHLRGARNVTLHEIPGTKKHADIAGLIARGEFDTVIKDFVRRDAGVGVGAPA